MSWQGVLGHDRVIEQFRRSIGRGRLASTFLFVGPAGIGKRKFAIELARAFLCQTNPESLLDACGHCAGCQQVSSLSHPDLELVSRPEDRAVIPVEAFIGDREHRMREGLCHNISLKPFCGGRKIAIIDDADYLNQEGANCLLKTLEEPPPRSVLILIGTSEQKQLPTIRSRCQIVRFYPLSEDHVAELLLANGTVTDETEARRLAILSQGSLERAAEMADPELAEFRDRLLAELSQGSFRAGPFAKEFGEFVDAAGKEAALRRRRMRQLINIAADFYRSVMHAKNGQPLSLDEKTTKAVHALVSRNTINDETAAACVERCLDTFAHVEANANQATLLECWLDELSEIARTGRLLPNA